MPTASKIARPCKKWSFTEQVSILLMEASQNGIPDTSGYLFISGANMSGSAFKVVFTGDVSVI